MSDQKPTPDTPETATWPPLPPEATAMLQGALAAHEAAVAEARDTIADALTDALQRANDALRQRLTVIALGGPDDPASTPPPEVPLFEMGSDDEGEATR